MVPQYFTFSAQESNCAGAPKKRVVLTIRRLTIAAPFSGQSFIYRIGDFSYERDPYAQFLVTPEQSLAEPVRAYLQQTGKFNMVVEPGSALKPNILIEIDVPELYGDFRNLKAPAAVLTMSCLCFDTTNGLPGRVLCLNTFSRRVPLKTRTASALMAGWNEALKELVSQGMSIPTNDAR